MRYWDERSKLSKIPPLWIVLWSRMVGSWPSITFEGCRCVLQGRIWLKDQLRMLQRAWIMWNNNLVIQRLTEEMEFAVTYSIPDNSFSQELWVSQVPGSVGLFQPQTLPGRCLRLNLIFNSPGNIAKRCKTIGSPQRDCILEWARLNPERISQFLDRLADEPKWQILFCGIYDSLRLLFLRLYNRTVELMELQLKH